MNPLKSFLDIIYPPRCLICRRFLGEQGVEIDDRQISLCPGCYGSFQEIGSPLCPVCGKMFRAGFQEDHYCEDCLRKRPYYESSLTPYLYEGPLMKAIYQFKYGAERRFGDALGPILAHFGEERIKVVKDAVTMPVPLHPKRVRERGFNQSLLLARHVAKRLKTDLDFLSLKRVKHTIPQTGLGKKERRKNVRRAFQMEKRNGLKGKTVLLVDDVTTTGSTLNECARVLKRAGCKEVVCLTLART